MTLTNQEIENIKNLPINGIEGYVRSSHTNDIEIIKQQHTIKEELPITNKDKARMLTNQLPGAVSALFRDGFYQGAWIALDAELYGKRLKLKKDLTEFGFDAKMVEDFINKI